jgi:hypothetical protein
MIRLVRPCVISTSQEALTPVSLGRRAANFGIGKSPRSDKVRRTRKEILEAESLCCKYQFEGRLEDI